jgi:ABC-type spermidine/putrescine transport system permease subunit II
VKRSFFSVTMLALVLAFLYVPILLVVVYGFIPNGISMSFFDSAGRFTGFSGKWYAMIFTGNMRLDALMQSFWLSLTIAGLATLISCAIGTTAALALHKWMSRLQSLHHALVYTPLIMPDILIGISLLMLFVACGVDCGFWTILIAHVTFCVSYVTMTVLARLQDFDDRITEAAYDLGAKKSMVYSKIILPLSVPGIVSGITMVFIPALTTFVISNMLGGGKINLIGNIIEQEFTVNSNWYLGSGLSLVMMVFIIISMLALQKFDKTGGANLI